MGGHKRALPRVAPRCSRHGSAMVLKPSEAIYICQHCVELAREKVALERKRYLETRYRVLR
jgi:hypothetical protein